jgi:uncharacterized protein (DUF362 family)/Pyruvate/2-oxoacid:ferredoxin oxidoreductase delta subunit
MLSPVALVFCSGYDEEEVERAVRRGFALFGGPEALCPGVKSVLLKPNLLVGEVPERAVTTHPAVFRAVAKVFLEAGYRVGFGDSPAFGSPESVAKKAGILEVARALGVDFADFTHGVEVDFPEGVQHRKFTIARGVREYDALVSLPKWKTHGLTRVTGAVKNQLGCVPGIRKGEYHFRIPDAILFSRMLVDLNRLLRPAFFVMDAVVAMEGNGPRNGKPRFMGLLAFSRDPVALDATLARLIHLDPALVPTCSEGERLGLGTWRREAIVLWGDDPERFEQRDFEVLRLPQVSPSRKPFLPLVRRFLLPYPVIRRKLCKGCGVCTEVCPVHPKALRWSESIRLPSIEYARCIRCFVCQEVCPHGAILVGVPLVRRVLGKMA